MTPAQLNTPPAMQDMLAPLHEVSTPALIGWWPPAIGWWLVLALSILLSAYVAFALRRYRRQYAWRNIVLKGLDQAIKRYLAQPTASNQAQIVALLKQGIASAQSDRLVMAQPMSYWQALLQQQPFALEGSEVNHLLAGHYQAQTAPLAPQTLAQLRKGLARVKALRKAS